VDLRRPIDLALSIFPVLRGRGRYELAVDVPKELPAVKGNVNAIQQVLVNLLKNAKDALDEKGGGRLALSVVRDEDAGELRVRVEDEGPGIAEDAREKVFQPFFTTKQEGAGTGLGLHICRQIMGEHGGRIEVETPLGPAGGAAFTLVFPALREAQPAAAAPLPVPALAGRP
jgi:C4-dicarboxylate-specific signal transduction histidine kinase